MSWLNTHLDKFVIPTINKDVNRTSWLFTELHPSILADFLPRLQKSNKELKEVLLKEAKESKQFFSKEELTIIKNVWRAIKKEARNKTILLPGRDIFIFEILARRENFPTLFLPECSRQTVDTIYENLFKNEDMNKYFVFDTGFVGSIPLGLKSNNFKMLSSRVTKYYFEKENYIAKLKTQVFPKLTMSRGLALKIESTPKYWETGRIVEHRCYTHTIKEYERRITQPLAHINEIWRAAILTIQIYTNSAPKWINKHKPLLSGNTDIGSLGDII